MDKLIKKLEKAKDAVLYLLEHADGNVDFHDLSYWAKEVERVRTEIRKNL